VVTALLDHAARLTFDRDVRSRFRRWSSEDGACN
jgi:hypothetical protein